MIRAALPALALIAAPSAAGGFLIQEQSATGLGRAFAGDGAQADSALDQWANPALLADLRRPQVAGSLTGLFLTADATDAGSTRTGPGDTRPVGGRPGSNPFSPVTPLPAVALALPLGPDTVAGVAVTSPFGLIVRYPEDWIGRYDSTYSRLRTYNLAASLAHRFGPIALGAGIDVQRIDARLEAAVPNPLAAADGRQIIEGDDWSLGWHAGVTLAPTPALRLAAAYRSGVRHTLDGGFELAGLQAPLAAANGRVAATAPVRLPDQITFSARITPAPGTRVLASAIRTGWSSFDAIRVFTADGRTLVSPQDYRSTWRYAAGLEHDLRPDLTLRAGLQRDNTPTVDSDRSTRVPDGDRTWVALGATWRATPAVTLSAAYAHIFVTDEPVNRTESFFAGTPLATSATTRLTGSGNADIVGLQASIAF